MLPHFKLTFLFQVKSQNYGCGLLIGLFNLFDVFCMHLGASGIVKILYRKERSFFNSFKRCLHYEE